MSKRVVIAGFGDTGVLVAIHLSGAADIVGISPKPCLVSGQELGTRLTDPEAWRRDYLMSFSRYRKLDDVQTRHGAIERIDLDGRVVHGRLADGMPFEEPFDVLVLSSGVTNGFWRTDVVEDRAAIEEGIAARAEQMQRASSIGIVGGGVTGVSVASNLMERYPGKAVHLFFSRDEPLPEYHPKVRAWIVRHLEDAGVQLHPGHRAVLPEGVVPDCMTNAPLEWSSGQPPWQGDLVLWAVGSARPNSSFIPNELLDEEGYVRAEPTLQVPGYPHVFTVGDIAATDVQRSSARNWGAQLAAKNIRAYLTGRPLASYRPPRHRWGSILGVQRAGMRVFQPAGGSFRVPRWAVRRLLFPLAVHRAIYRGVRKS